MKHALRVLFGLAVSAIFLYVTFRGFDFVRLREAISAFRFSYLFLSVPMFSSVILLRAVRWKIVIDSMEKVPFSAVAPTVAVGYLSNNFLPARGGELVRAAALSRMTGVPFASITGSLIADRIMDLFGLVMAMLIAARLLPWERIPILPVVAAAVVGVVGMVVAARVLTRLRPTGEAGLKQKIVGFVARLGEGFAAVRSPKRVATLMAVSAVLWMLDAGNMLVIARAAGLHLSYTEATAVLVGIAAAVSIPAAPGFVGTYEFFGTEVLKMLGHDAASALTFVVLLHFFQILLIAALGIPSLFLISGKKGAART